MSDMAVNISEGRVTIDDGKLIIAKPSPGEYHVRANDFAVIETNTGQKAPTPTVKYDPHYYHSGGNNLTVEASAERALDRVYEMVDDAQHSLGDEEDVYNTIKDIIADPGTEGRHTVYTLAGGILKGYRDGLYKGVPFSYIFKGQVEGKIVPEKKPQSSYALSAYVGAR